MPMPKPNTQTLIEVTGLSFNAPSTASTRTGSPLLQDLNCAIKPDGTTAIMGPNGAGKTVFLRCLAGLLAPSSGNIKWFGKNSFEKNEVAIVFQKPTLLRRSVKANLVHALKTYKKDHSPEIIKDLLDKASLNDLAERPARVLSGGEQQRLSLVRALAAAPKILLLDEPTASLDPQATIQIESLIKQAEASGIKIIIISHDKGQVKRLAKNTLFIKSGKLLEDTPTAKFLTNPKTKDAAAYLAGEILV